MYANHRLFDKKGRRLAIFGREINNTLEVFVLTCSKHDSFNKKIATQVYNLHLEGKPLEINVYGYNYPSTEKVVKSTLTFKPNIYNIAITDPAQSKNEFLQHCADTFCYPYPTFGVVKLSYLTDAEAEAEFLNYLDND
jgi:hypothetical protein